MKLGTVSIATKAIHDACLSQTVKDTTNLTPTSVCVQSNVPSDLGQSCFLAINVQNPSLYRCQTQF